MLIADLQNGGMSFLTTSLSCSSFLLLQQLLRCSSPLFFSFFPFLLFLLPPPTQAPVPRCGPLIIINKVNLGGYLSYRCILLFC